MFDQFVRNPMKLSDDVDEFSCIIVYAKMPFERLKKYCT